MSVIYLTNPYSVSFPNRGLRELEFSASFSFILPSVHVVRAMTTIEYEQFSGGLTRVNWQVKISSVKDRVARVSKLILPRPHRFTVAYVCKLISGNETTGPCDFAVLMTLIDNKTREVQKDDITDNDYCFEIFSVWGDVHNFPSCNQGKKQLLKKASKDKWESEIFSVKFPARSSRDLNFEHKATGCQDDPNSLYFNYFLWIRGAAVSVNKSKNNVGRQLVEIFVHQTYCDVQFIFEDKQRIGSHVAILSSRSPVFAAMFQHNMKENQRRQVDILDVKPFIFHQLLYYIYSGRLEIPLSEENAQLLYVAADKYDIGDLKEECVKFLLSHIGVDNSVHLLAWAHLYSVDEIKEATLDIFSVFGEEICCLDDWANLKINNPDLCFMATQRMSKVCLIGFKPNNYYVDCAPTAYF